MIKLKEKRLGGNKFLRKEGKNTSSLKEVGTRKGGKKNIFAEEREELEGKRRIS